MLWARWWTSRKRRKSCLGRELAVAHTGAVRVYAFTRWTHAAPA